MPNERIATQSGQSPKVPVIAVGNACFSAYVVAETLYVEDIHSADVSADTVDGLLAHAREAGCSQLVLRGASDQLPEAAIATLQEHGGRPISLSVADAIFAFDVDLDDEARSNPAVQEAARKLQLGQPLPPDITVYLVPHQDDELYTWGIDIANRTLAGENVAVILLTDGAACGARLLLGNGGSCVEIGDFHGLTLDKAACTQARDREFTESCMSLGVPEGNIHFALQRLRDLSITEEAGLSEIRRILQAYPFARICAHAPRYEVSSEGAIDESAPPHRDHRVLGKALDAMLRQGAVAWAEFCIEFYDIERFREANPLTQVEERHAADGAQPLLDAALAAYKKWDPDNGRYAFGWHTGPELHDQVRANDTCYILASQDGGQ